LVAVQSGSFFATAAWKMTAYLLDAQATNGSLFHDAPGRPGVPAFCGGMHRVTVRRFGDASAHGTNAT